MPEIVLAADFLLRYPGFSGVPEPQLEAQLEDANLTFNESAFSSRISYRRAVMLLTAHNLSLMGVGTTIEARLVADGYATDNIQSVSDSGVSISLRDTTGSGTGSIYGATSFGRELAKLIRTSGAFATVGVRHRIIAPAESVPLPPVDPGTLVISDDPDNIIEWRGDGIFAAPKLNSDQW